MKTTHYAKGTSLTHGGPWQVCVKAQALCPDGKVRTTVRIAQMPDTFFSIPAAVQVNRKTVSGYITCDRDSEGNEVVEFRPYKYRKNANAFNLGASHV